jgi:hypothetical protein
MWTDGGISADHRHEIQASARRRQPIYVVCSPRSRVGRSLIARVLVEYVLSDGRRVIGFDVNPEDRALSRHLPLYSLPASISDSRGQVALYDRLIINDGAVKVVDLAADQFQSFFEIMQQIGFSAEARANSIDVVVLFIVADDPRSEAAYRRLLVRRDQFTVVPVENAAAATPPGAMSPPLPHAASPVVVPELPAMLRKIGEAPAFSFADCIKRQSDSPRQLNGWVGRMFVAFRDLERRLQVADAATMFAHPVESTAFDRVDPFPLEMAAG